MIANGSSLSRRFWLQNRLRCGETRIGPVSRSHSLSVFGASAPLKSLLASTLRHTTSGLAARRSGWQLLGRP